MKKLIPIALLGALLLQLQGCTTAVVGGAATGAAVALDRRTAGVFVSDQEIELRAMNRLREAFPQKTDNISTTSYNRQVLLTGEVPSAQDKQLAEQVVARVENVRAIVNELGVMGSSSFTQRSNDALITGKVKAALVDARDLYASAYKVVTERGVTYLMGRVTQREADRGTDVARSTSGVQKVVRMFEIISEEELQALLPKPAENEKKK